MRIYNDEDRHSNRINPSPAITRKSMGERRKNHFSQKHSVGFGGKNRPGHYRFVIGER